MSHSYFKNRFSRAKIAGRPSLRNAAAWLLILILAFVIGGAAPYAGGAAEGNTEEKAVRIGPPSPQMPIDCRKPPPP